jgi:LuxR family transcriptional regulator, quorum-sensing system regulator BjaR1
VDKRAPSPIQLTPRQLECLTRIAAGETSVEIAAALGLSKRTVDHYVTHACARLGVRNRAQAVAKAIRSRLIPGRAP